MRDYMNRDAKGFLEASKGELVLPVGMLLQTIRRKFWVVLLAILACTSALVLYSLQQTPVYQTSAMILVGQDRGIVGDPSQTVNLQQLTLTMSEAVATRPVTQPVVEELGLRGSPESLIANTRVEVIPETQFIEVSYTDTDSQRAQRVVNAIADQFIAQVSEVSPNVGAVSAIVWERATVPTSPISPNPMRNGLIGFVLGIIFGVMLAFMLDYLDDRWRSPKEAEQVSGFPTLVEIPEFEDTKVSRQDNVPF
jgi:capsular polysaccharide biosynthesis protein